MISHFQPCKASFQHWSLSLMIWGDSLFSFLSGLKIEKFSFGNKLLTLTLGTVQSVEKIKHMKLPCYEARISNLLISFEVQISFKLCYDGKIVTLLCDITMWYLGQPFTERFPNLYPFPNSYPHSLYGQQWAGKWHLH